MKKKYLLTYLGIFPGYKLLSSLKELTKNEKEMCRDHSAKLFKTEDGEIVEIDLSGRKK
jgi:hypothetical protein